MGDLRKEMFCSGGNRIVRISNRLNNKLEKIDVKREENGLDKISHPKKTDLIVRHKNWKKIEDDIILFNLELDKERENVK